MSNEIVTCNYIVELTALRYKSLQRLRNEVDHWKSEGSVILCLPCSSLFPQASACALPQTGSRFRTQYELGYTGPNTYATTHFTHMGTAFCKGFN